jgi:hypothetical protein
MRRKRGDGGEDCGDLALLGAVGLGNFALLGLPDPPGGLEVDAAYEPVSGRIAVSVGGEGVSASPADLAAGLGLPPGAVGPSEGVGADFLSSPEAIAAVGRFVRDRVILGDGEYRGTASEEVAAALRLFEEGKAYEVDWAGLVWAVLKGEMVGGTPGRYAPFLLRLLEYRRPDNFADVDERFPLRKRLKGRIFQMNEKFGISEEYELEEDEEDISMDYGLSQDIGDLEEMPMFGEGRGVTLDIPRDCKGGFLEQEEIHETGQGHTELQSQSLSAAYAKRLGGYTECEDGEANARSDVNNQTFASNSSFGWRRRTMDEQHDSSSPQGSISGIKSQPASNLQSIIEVEDEDGGGDDLGVGARSAVIRNAPLDITRYPVQQHRSFNGCLQQISVHVLSMEKGYSNKEKHCRQLRAEVQCLQEMVMEKQRLIEATKCDILENLRANNTKIYQFKKASEVMSRSVQHYRELLKKTSAEFQEYKNMMMCDKGVNSYLGVSGITEQKLASMQQLHTCCLWIQRSWCSASLKLDEKVKQMAKDMANIDYEVKRLKDSISIPDLNSGKPQL